MSKWSEIENLSLSAQAFTKRTRAAEIAVFVELVVPKLRDAARARGYAIGLHGSEARDLDLILVPWTERAVEPDVMIKALSDACHDATGWGYRSGDEWTVKPHGRRALTLLGSDGVNLDVSIMPLAPKPPAETS